MAPPEVSALPDGGTVADLEASGDVVLAVGGFAGVSAAKTGAVPIDSANAVSATRRNISRSFLSLHANNAFGTFNVSFLWGAVRKSAATKRALTSSWSANAFRFNVRAAIPVEHGSDHVSLTHDSA